MGSYRIYHVGGGGRLQLGDTFQATSDEEAVARAQVLLARGKAAELWQAGRMVGRFSETHQFERGRGGG